MFAPYEASDPVQHINNNDLMVIILSLLVLGIVLEVLAAVFYVLCASVSGIITVAKSTPAAAKSALTLVYTHVILPCTQSTAPQTILNAISALVQDAFVMQRRMYDSIVSVGKLAFEVNHSACLQIDKTVKATLSVATTNLALVTKHVLVKTKAFALYLSRFAHGVIMMCFNNIIGIAFVVLCATCGSSVALLLQAWILLFMSSNEQVRAPTPLVVTTTTLFTVWLIGHFLPTTVQTRHDQYRTIPSRDGADMRAHATTVPSKQVTDNERRQAAAMTNEVAKEKAVDTTTSDDGPKAAPARWASSAKTAMAQMFKVTSSGLCRLGWHWNRFYGSVLAGAMMTVQYDPMVVRHVKVNATMASCYLHESTSIPPPMESSELYVDWDDEQQQIDLAIAESIRHHEQVFAGSEISFERDIGVAVTESLRDPERLDIPQMGSGLSLRRLKEVSCSQYQDFQLSGRIKVLPIDTYQGSEVALDSTNGCVVIATLMVAHHLDADLDHGSNVPSQTSDGMISNERVKHVIDHQCVPFLQFLRTSQNVERFGMLHLEDVVSHLSNERMLHDECFADVVNGNVLDAELYENFIGSLCEPRQTKVAAVFLFDNHAVSIVRVTDAATGNMTFDLIDSLPSIYVAPSSGGSPQWCSTRKRCHGVESLRVLLNWYVTNKFSDEACARMDAGQAQWRDDNASTDRRAFQGYIWAKKRNA